MNTLNCKQPFSLRFSKYLKERFAPMEYGFLSLVFSLAGLCLSSSLRLGTVSLPLQSTLSAMAVTLFMFFQLRVIDEHKDHENDCLYLPERPVPRGLVSLSELKVVGLSLLGVQLVLCLTNKITFLLLLLSFCYMGLMAREFFAGNYLARRPMLYMLVHMPVMLFIDLVITSFDFALSGFDARLLYFFAASFLSGIIVEVGRKVLPAPQPGITSYNHILGLKSATVLLQLCIVLAQVCLCLVLSPLSHSWLAPLAFLVFDFLVLPGYGKAKDQTLAKVFAKLSNLSVLFGYLTVLMVTLIHSFFH
ncbi:MAG: UbiA family prenyltransferase [Candidatus Obscuribacter phosphatis]|uniref:UbiA family prenyltransferase n=1 Tax=Candidatus Obscuribacter phosphatis TaxID=1906157 RepID=A0A8J7TMG4_9BACT|nr:UbiA family prenyltransferase [Candidatus Obscuribacter phosphatis]